MGRLRVPAMTPNHPNCRCKIEFNPLTKPDHKFWEEGCKMQAKLLLATLGKRCLQVPTHEEWVGMHLLERDDQLTR